MHTLAGEVFFVAEVILVFISTLVVKILGWNQFYVLYVGIMFYIMEDVNIKNKESYFFQNAIILRRK